MRFLLFLAFFISSGQCLKEVRRKNEHPYLVETFNSKKVLFLDGFFAIHRQGRTTECGEINGPTGIYLAEAMRWAVDYWNRHEKEAKDHSHFFGYTLGFRIYDTCKSTNRLAQSVNVIMSAMLQRSVSHVTAGIIGPPTAEEALFVSLATNYVHLGIISYSGLSTKFNDRGKFGNVFSIVSHEDVQIKILVDILKRYNWKYISTVSSDGTFGQEGTEGLLRLLHKEGIYTSTRNALPRKPTKADFDAVVNNLEKDSNARTVVLFTKSEDTLRLLEAAKSKTRFQWLSSTAWDADMQTIKGVNEAAKGAIILSYTPNEMKTAKRRFMSHFKNLTLNTNRYPWFEEFWEQQFNCTVKTKGNLKGKICTGKENLKDSQFYANYAASTAVVRAIEKFSKATRCAFNYICPNAEKFRNFTGCLQKNNQHRLRGYTWQFLMAKFSRWCNPSDKFNKKGTFDPDFDVVNFDGEAYKTVGSWKLNSATLNGTLYINDTMVVWYNGSRQIPQSICSRPCEAGERRIVSKLREICFRCEACKKNEILKNNKCIACHELSTPSKDRSDCKKLPKFHVSLQHHLSILVLVESTIGFISNTVVLIVFIKYSKSKIIKASSRELSFFILAGLYLCFLSPCIFLLEPTKVRCGLRRFIFGISLTACYTPLMLKTNRIYRIFNAARSIGNMPHLVTQKSQILMCFGLLALQLLLCVMWVVGAPPVVTHKIFDGEFKMVAYLCKSDILTTSINLVPCFCMLGASTFYAFKTRKFHKNFNEASNIVVTMYISCALWAMLVPLLLWIKVQYSNPFGQLFVVANFCNVIGLVSLFGIFGPKMFRLIRCKGNEHTFFTNVDRSNDGIDKKSLDMHTMGAMESEGRTMDNGERTIGPGGRTICNGMKTIDDDKRVAVAGINEDIKVNANFNDDFKERSKTC